MDEEDTSKSEQAGDSVPGGEEEVAEEVNGMTENEMVAVILLVTVLGLVIFGVYVYSNRRHFGIGSSGGHKVNTRELSKERDAYYKTKSGLDASDPAQFEELKKALMRRAMFTIPMILNLQQQGKSVDRLYGRGMLTDEIMDNVKSLKEFVDAEFPDVQAEADDIVPGWGPAIWQEAMQFHRMVQQHHQAEQAKEGGGNNTGGGSLSRDPKDRKAAAAERRRKNAANVQMSAAELLKKKEAEAEKMAAQLIKEEELEKKKKRK